MRVADRDLLQELDPVAERLLADHLCKSRAWHPHDYVPWGEGRNFAALGGDDWLRNNPRYRRWRGWR